jgi:hypothetical protein
MDWKSKPLKTKRRSRRNDKGIFGGRQWALELEYLYEEGRKEREEGRRRKALPFHEKFLITPLCCTSERAYGARFTG